MAWTAGAALWILASSASAVSAETPSKDLVIPTRMCGEYFLIPIEVDLDGDGTATTLTAVFDTGGAGLHIDPDAVSCRRPTGSGSSTVGEAIGGRTSTSRSPGSGIGY